jgi:hypothetical protein
MAAMWNTGMIVFLGIWMLIAPFLVPTAEGQAWNNRIVATAAVVLIFAVPRAYRWEAFAAAAVAVWLFASSFVPALLFDDGLLWNDAAVGVLFIASGAQATRQTRARVAPHLAP